MKRIYLDSFLHSHSFLAMGDVIKFKQYKKAKARSDKEQKAEENRRLFGRTKAEKKLQKLEDARAAKEFEGHKREKDEEE